MNRWPAANASAFQILADVGAVAIRLALVAILMALLGCGGGNSRRSSSALDLAAANGVSMHAIGLVGTPYRYGGNTPASGFDCSGLIGYVYREAAGISLPRSTRDIAAMAAPNVAAEELRVGDLILFGSKHQVEHAGIYVGERRFVHAPSAGGTVRLDSLDSEHWKRRLLGGRRPIR